MSTKAVRTFAASAKASYDRVYSVFERSAVSIGADVAPLRTSGQCFEVQNHVTSIGKQAVEVLGALKIELLPERHMERAVVPPQSRVCVLLSSRDVYFFRNKRVADTSFLGQSFVSLAYYRSTQAGWKTRLALRYDYNSRGARQAHPIFHAQVSTGQPGPNLMPLLPPGMPAITPQGDAYETIRLPTANMIGVTALVKLAADHLPHDLFKEVLKHLRSAAFFDAWRCDCSTLDDDTSVRGILGSGWYSLK